MVKRTGSLVLGFLFMIFSHCVKEKNDVMTFGGIPLIDISAKTEWQVIVDKEKGQYLGHPTTVLLEDGKTIIVVYPKGHGKGAIVMKKSTDGGKTWSERLPVPDNWATSQEVPTIYRLVTPQGNRRLVLFSGVTPVRMAVSEDDGVTWSPLQPMGDWGGIVAMASCVPLKTGKGHYLAMFHNWGENSTRATQKKTMVLYQIRTLNGGVTWSEPEAVFRSSEIHLCEPGIVRSPDGTQLAVLLRENTRTRNSFVMFSDDEGKSWSKPQELPVTLTGDRHTGKYLPDGRLFVAFRDMAKGSPTRGDWVAWVGKYEDIVSGKPGQFRIRIMDNKHEWDCGYPGVEILPDGTIVTTSYGHWEEGEEPYVVCVRFRIEEVEKELQD